MTHRMVLLISNEWAVPITPKETGSEGRTFSQVGHPDFPKKLFHDVPDFPRRCMRIAVSGRGETETGDRSGGRGIGVIQDSFFHAKRTLNVAGPPAPPRSDPARWIRILVASRLEELDVAQRITRS